MVEAQVHQHLCVMQNVAQNHAQVSNQTGAKKGKERKTRCGAETKTEQKVNQQERRQIVTKRKTWKVRESVIGPQGAGPCA